MAVWHCFTASANMRSICSLSHSPIDLPPPCPSLHSPHHRHGRPSTLHGLHIPFRSISSSRCRCRAMYHDDKILGSIASEEEIVTSGLGAGSDMEGPIELPAEEDPFAFLTSAGASSPLQSAISILFTGTLAIVLYGSLRKRVKLVKGTKFRSSGLASVDKRAVEKNNGPISSAPKKQGPKAPPSAFQTFQGGIIAGAIAYVLYNFATTVDAGFASKPVSAVYTIRQLTITIRTIVTGICYLATFVFAANSLGLCLYSIQIALNLGAPVPPASLDVDATNGEIEPTQLESPQEVKEEK